MDEWIRNTPKWSGYYVSLALLVIDLVLPFMGIPQIQRYF